MPDPKHRAAAAYNAAADHYDDAANSFWERFGRATIDRLQPEAGARVLDVCCGSGASALPAAERVGPGGHVVGIDLAENMLKLARAKAAKRRLANIEFRRADMLQMQLGGAQFDAVVCVFGIFFVPDMRAAVSTLWDAVTPGGKLAITTWGPRFFEPATTAFWNAVREVRSDLYKGFNPWDRICDPFALRALLSEGGVANADVVAESNTHPIPSPEAWWSAVLGSGYRSTIDQLTTPERIAVHEANSRYIRESRISSVEANVVYALARK